MVYIDGVCGGLYLGGGWWSVFMGGWWSVFRGWWWSVLRGWVVSTPMLLRRHMPDGQRPVVSLQTYIYQHCVLILTRHTKGTYR